ncbi:shifted isoform X1, partial [Paramuricea clavata]
TIIVPTKRLVSKTLYRVVERCCEGWTGDDCMTGVNPGICPRYSSPGRVGVCADECQTDADCGKTKKCCRSTCIGLKCLSPAPCKCLNGGICDANFRCVCPIGFSGNSCEFGIRKARDSCVKQNIVIKYGTVSSDTLTLNVSKARAIMQQLVDIGKKELNSKCRSKATLRLGTVQVSESSGYTIEASLEYLVYAGYRRWNFATCVANANLFQDIVNDPKKAPAIQGQYSSYGATNVTKGSSGLSVASTCCNPGSVVNRGSC